MIELKPNLAISDKQLVQNAHQYYAAMRQSRPVYKARMGMRRPAYLITRYEDVHTILKDPRLIKDVNGTRSNGQSSSMFWMPKAFRPLLHNMLSSDEPNHRRLRNLVHKAFTPRMITQLEPRIQQIATDLLYSAKQKGTVDLMQAFALPLPVTVIAEMIGIPEEDRPEFLGWARKIVVNPTPLNLVKAIPAVRNFLKYIRILADKRRIAPQQDLLTGLVQAEDDGDRLSEDELLGMIFLLLVAGHETTVGLIANGVHALLSHPDQFQQLKDNPTIMSSAIEEILRFDGPLQTTEMGFAKEPITLHGVTIPTGALILPVLLSANRDSAAFENPDQLDLERHPNRHLAFGHGIHYCLGAPLARLEAKIAFCSLMEMAPNLQLADRAATLQYEQIPLIHRPRELMVNL